MRARGSWKPRWVHGLLSGMQVKLQNEGGVQKLEFLGGVQKLELSRSTCYRNVETG